MTLPEALARIEELQRELDMAHTALDVLNAQREEEYQRLLRAERALRSRLSSRSLPWSEQALRAALAEHGL